MKIILVRGSLTLEYLINSYQNIIFISNAYTKIPSNKTIDVIGALTLAATITSFLLVLTFLETGSDNSS
jgi:hypothetical protein